MDILQRGTVHKVTIRQELEASVVMAYVDDYTQGLLSESEFLHKLGFTAIPLSPYDTAKEHRLLIDLA
jgi:hypothetical protein